MVPNPSLARRRDPGRRSIAVVAAFLSAILMLPAATSPLRADAVAVVPDEPGATVLPEFLYGALTADVKGDGSVELVTLGHARANPSLLAVELWAEAANGTWFTTGQASLLRRASPDERLSAVPHPDAQGMFGVAVNDAARLLAWHNGTRTDALVAVRSGTGFGSAPPCCLTIYRISADPLTGAPVLNLVADTGRGARALLVADLDGDGTDELIAAEAPDPATPGRMRVTVLRWNGSRFSDTAPRGHPLWVSADDPLNATVSVIGDSDGLPGVEIGLVGAATSSPGCAGAGWRLTRIALRSGLPSQESMCLSTRGVPMAVPDTRTAGGSTILYGDYDTAVIGIEWPAGAPGRVASRVSSLRTGRPVAVLGAPANPWVVLERFASTTPVIELDRPDMSLTEAHGVAASEAASKFIDSPLPPYVGPWPATPQDVAGFMFEGSLIQPQAAEPPATRPVAMLAGAAPIGLVGPGGPRDSGGSELAILRTVGPGTLVDPGAVDPRGGALDSATTPGVVSVVPLATVETPEEAGGTLDPALVDAIPDPTAQGGRGGILAGSRTFIVEAGTPPGSLAFTRASGAGQLVVLGEEIPGQRPDGAVGPPFRITVTAPSAESGRFPADLLLVTPAGHGYRASFSVRVISGAPALSVGAGFFSLGLDATVSGRTDPGARVVVDGADVPVAADGSFRASVPAGLAPRAVTVLARDPFGHVATKQVSVLAPLDYRQLPWIPIIVALTVVAGVVLFLRAPRPTAPRGEVTVDEGILEEVDPD